VVLDSRLRLPLDSRIVRSAAADGAARNDVVIFCRAADEKKRIALEARGIRVEQVSSAPDGRPALPEILHRLGQFEITSVMLEGGATVNSAALHSGVVDKIFLYYAPIIMGSAASVPFAASDSLPWNGARQVTDVQVNHFGQDFSVEGYLRDPYSG